MATTKIDIKNKTINGKKMEDSCESCMHLPVCWLVVSMKTALVNHSNAGGEMMFDWKKLGQICDQYHTAGLMITTSDL